MLANQQPLLSRLDSLEAPRTWSDLLVDSQRKAGYKGGCPLGSLAGELAEAYPDCRTNFADAFDQWQTAIRDGPRAMQQRGGLQRTADPDRLATAMLAAVQRDLLLTKVQRDIAPIKSAGATCEPLSALRLS